MQKYIDASSILSEARMMRTDCKETYILIEGDSDKTFFRTLSEFPSSIRFRPVHGWEKVYETINLAQQEKYANIFGIIDKDYHLLINDGVVENEQLVFTDQNDIEMMMFFSSAFDKFLAVCADETKLASHMDPRKPVLSAASIIGALRAISLDKKYNLHFDGFDCKDFIDKNTLTPDLDRLIERIIQRTRSQGKHVNISIKELADEHQSFVQSNNVSFLCNGHDVLDILGIAMNKLFASSSANQYNADNIFHYLLVGYPVEEFQRSRLYQKLADWISEHVAA